MGTLRTPSSAGRHAGHLRRCNKERAVREPTAPTEPQTPRGPRHEPEAEPPPPTQHAAHSLPTWSWEALPPALRQRLLRNPINWRETLRNDPCAFCSGPGNQTAHIVPPSTGGTNIWSNLTAACHECRNAKGSLPLLAHLNQTNRRSMKLTAGIRILDGLRLATCSIKPGVGGRKGGIPPIEHLLEQLLATNPDADGAMICRRRRHRLRRLGKIHHALMLRPEAGSAASICTQHGGSGTRTRGSFYAQRRAGRKENETATTRPASHGHRRRRGDKAPGARSTTPPVPPAWLNVIRNDPCALCGGPGGTIDHIVAKSTGGTSSWDNLAGTCAECNSRKGATNLLRFLQLRVDEKAGRCPVCSSWSGDPPSMAARREDQRTRQRRQRTGRRPSRS